jgi:hypothetical protein
VSSEGLVVTLPGTTPDPDVSVAALEFDGPVQFITMNAANSPAESSGAGTPADPSGATTPH